MFKQLGSIFRAVASCVEQERDHLNSPAHEFGETVVVNDEWEIEDRSLRKRAKLYGKQILTAAQEE